MNGLLSQSQILLKKSDTLVKRARVLRQGSDRLNVDSRKLIQDTEKLVTSFTLNTEAREHWIEYFNDRVIEFPKQTK